VLIPRADAVVRSTAPAPTPAPQLEALDRRLKRRLARGGQSIDDRIDLHGRTQGEAHAALLRFLRKAQRDGAKVALVITGKGAPARDSWSERGVLKRQVPQWLKLPEFRAYVLGFEDAPMSATAARARFMCGFGRRWAEAIIHIVAPAKAGEYGSPTHIGYSRYAHDKGRSRVYPRSGARGRPLCAPSVGSDLTSEPRPTG
jgi:hypothetical protein